MKYIILLVSARHRHGSSAKIFIRGREKADSKKALRQIELGADFMNDQGTWEPESSVQLPLLRLYSRDRERVREEREHEMIMNTLTFSVF